MAGLARAKSTEGVLTTHEQWQAAMLQRGCSVRLVRHDLASPNFPGPQST